MNLKEMRSMSFSLVGDPRETKVTFGEMIIYLNMGQYVVNGVLANVEREKYLQITSRTIGLGQWSSADADGEYSLPFDCRDLVRVIYNTVEARKIPAADINAINVNSLYRPVLGTAHFYVEVGGKVGANYVGTNRIRIYPTPSGGDGVEMWYYKMPIDFDVVGTYEGTISSVASASEFNDASVPFSGSATKTGVDGWWNNGEVYIKSGHMRGTRRRITTFKEDDASAYGTYEFSSEDAFGAILNPGDAYDVSQVSVTPEQYHHLVCYYAAALAAPKAQMDPKPLWDTFNSEMQLVKTKWTANVDANLVGQISRGTRQYRRAEG